MWVAPYEPPRFGHVQVENSLIYVDGGSTHWLPAGWRTPNQLWNTLKANRARVTADMLSHMFTRVLTRRSFGMLVHLTFADENVMQTVYSRQLDYPSNKRFQIQGTTGLRHSRLFKGTIHRQLTGLAVSTREANAR